MKKPTATYISFVPSWYGIVVPTIPSRGIVLLCRNPVADVNKLYHLHIFCIFLPHNNISFNTDQRTDTIIMQTFALYQILPLAPSSSLIWRPSLPHQLYLSIVYSFHSVYSTNQPSNHPPWPRMNDDFPTELYSRLHTFRSRRLLYSVCTVQIEQCQKGSWCTANGAEI